MKRHMRSLAAVAVLACSIGACNRDDTTGLPAMSARADASSAVLHNAIAFFTREFSASGDIGVMKPDGSGRMPLPGSEAGFEPDISPDGRQVVFSRVTDVGVTAIFVMNVDGTGTASIAPGLVFNGEPRWSPDGCQVAFRSAREGDTGPTGRISIVNADGTGLRQLTPEPAEGEFAFDEGSTWSPDGTRLAFTRNALLHVINADGTGMTALPNEDMAQNPAWSPDGRWIAYMSVDPVGDIHMRTPDGSTLVRVTTTPEFESWPRWSPDGHRLVFSRDVAE